MSLAPRSLGRLLVVPSLLVVLLAGCGAPSSVRVEVAPADATLPLGGSATFTVTIAAATAPGPFALSVGTLPAGVTASFSDDSLGAAGDSSELTLTASAGAAEGAFTVTVSASGAAAAGSASLEVTVSGLTVQGRVVGQLGQPLPGVGVVVSGHAATTTALDGTFTVEDVVVPYDLTVYSAADGWAQVYEGLTIGAPEVLPLLSALRNMNVATATVSGEFPAAVPAGHEVRVCAEGVGTAVYGCTWVPAGVTGYEVEATWAGGADAELRLRAVEYSVDAEANPVAITRRGATGTFAVAEGGAADEDMALGGPGTSVSFQVLVSSPFPASEYFVNVNSVLPSGQSFAMDSFSGAASPVAAFAPEYAGATYAIAVQAQAADGRIGLAYRGGIAASGAQAFTVPQAPSFAGPADAVAGVDVATEFSVSGTPGRVNNFLFSGPDVAYVVTTASETTRIPDLAAQGLPLPSSTAMTWTVLSSPDHTDVDAAAETGGIVREYVQLVLLTNHGGEAPDGEVRLNTPGTRTFTTAP